MLGLTDALRKMMSLSSASKTRPSLPHPLSGFELCVLLLPLLVLFLLVNDSIYSLSRTWI